MTDSVILRIAPGVDRMAGVHAALRDLGLETCPRCAVWKPLAHFPDWAPATGQTHTICNSCAADAGDPA